MLHYINNILTSNAKNFKNVNKYHYTFISIIYTISSVFTKLFQKTFINLYSIFLQSNLLPFGAITSMFKKILIVFVNFDTWDDFLIKIKNNSNMYLLRQNSYTFLHNFWTIHYANKVKYNNELNIKYATSAEISNFYYNTKFPGNKLNVILYYFFNKIIFNRYPYFYWMYNVLYDSKAKIANEGTKSKNIRTQIFFTYFNLVDDFINNYDESFAKFNLNTFKGASNFFASMLNNVKFLIKKSPLNYKINVESDLTSNNQILNYKKYNNFTKNKSLNPNIFLNILANSINTFNSKLYEFKNMPFAKTLTLTWYTKIHNTTLNISQNSLILYLRSARHFNKGRYSRNRQLYRTGVYWCIWLNVVVVYALHYYFYRIVFTFGYLWLPLGIMILTIFSSRLYKYRFYSFAQITLEIKEYINLLFFFFLKSKLYIQLKWSKMLTNIKNFFLSYTIIIKLLLNNYIITFVKMFK